MGPLYLLAVIKWQKREGYLPIMPVNARNSAGTSRDKAGTSRDRARTNRDKQGQTGTSRDKHGHSLSVPACPCLFMLVPACPCLSLYVPVCPYMSLYVSLFTIPSCLPLKMNISLYQYEHSYIDFPCKRHSSNVC